MQTIALSYGLSYAPPEGLMKRVLQEEPNSTSELARNKTLRPPIKLNLSNVPNIDEDALFRRFEALKRK